MRLARAAIAAGALLLVVVVGLGHPAHAQTVSGDDAIAELQRVRTSIDHTLTLIKAGQADEAFAAARDGYLQHFENVEIPLRAIDNSLTIRAEAKFAEIRQQIRDRASVDTVRTSLIELRTLIDDCERRLTTVGPAAATLVLSQSFIIIFREGFEVVLLVSILLGYLEAARSTQFIKPILIGIGLAAVATALTVFAMRWLFAILPVSIEVVEAITALVAVAVLVYVSFWLVARLEHKRWMEFVKARLWSAVSLGSMASLVLVGFTSVYREGFETALFYQSLWSFGPGLGEYVLLGLALGIVALVIVSWAIFRLGRRLPVRRVHERRRGADHAQLDRLPRQRRALAAERRPRALPRARRLAATADLPRPGHGLLAHRPDRRRPSRPHRGLPARRAVRVRAPPDARQPSTVDTAAGVSAPLRIRVGVDVGGTFTKAVAVDVASGAVVAQAVVPTSHGAANGVAEGIVAAVVEVAAVVPVSAIDLITHSTTQAVNALLEGDVDPVGVIGLGRQPDLGRTRRRTTLSGVELTPGKRLATVPAFFDVTDGLPVADIGAALRRFRDEGVGSVCVAEAFSPDDDRNETVVAELARDAGFAVCASTELSGLYGLELRTVTAALNASVLPIAAATAEFVAGGAVSAGLHAPVMVMRGDGGATDLAGFRAAPVRTLYSGPAASVTGALRHARVRDGIIVEVGGTSTNVAAIRDGRPLLSYVRVATHATAVRALDVRVVGVAGGSMLRLRRRKVYGVGPRSAHIAGLGYAGYADAAALDGATVETIAPRAGDPPDHAVLRLVDGTSVAVTTTCAALALGIPQAGDHAATDPEAARAALAIVGGHCRLDGDEVARRMLAAAGEEVCDVVWALMRQQRLRRPTIVAVGGGAGGLGRHVAAMLDLPVDIPDGAAVISSIGDALSNVRAERERTVDAVDAAIVRRLADEVSAEVVASGAAPHTVEVRVEEHPERGTIRAMATGAIAADHGALADGDAVGREIGRYRLVTGSTTVTVLDREGGVVVELRGESVPRDALAAGYERLTRYRGPVTLRPSIVHVAGGRVVELTGVTAVAAATDLHDDDADDVYLVGRPT